MSLEDEAIRHERRRQLRRMVDEAGPVEVGEELQRILVEVYTNRPDPERRVAVTITEKEESK
jgi:hypothetical protein